MTEELLIEVMTLTFQVMAYLSAPIIVTVMAVGIISQVIQQVTQLKDTALAFVPKMVIAAIVFLFSVPWYFQVVRQYCDTIYSLIARVTE